MHRVVKNNWTFIVEVALIVGLWFISVMVSRPIFDRPLDTNLEYLTARSLVNLRAFEEWGFWNILGASILVPKSYEFLNADITTFGFGEGIRLGYPTFWLILPYGVFKLLNVLNFHVDLSVAYIQTYNLVVNRLICGIVIYYLFYEIISIIVGENLSTTKRRVFSSLGVLIWLFMPPVMYWTQNVYLTDQSILAPIYAWFLLALKCKFKFESLSRSGKFILFVLSLLSFGLDWYGWVVAAIILAIVAVNQVQAVQPVFSKAFLKYYWDSTKFIFLGGFLATLSFLVQLLYFKDGVSQLVGRFLRRTGLVPITDGSESSAPFWKSIRIIFSYWPSYFPRQLHDHFYKIIVPEAYKNMTPLEWFASALIITLTILFLVSSLLFLYQISLNKRLTIYAFVLLYLVPVIQLLFLRQHSHKHDFSALKMGMPLAFLLIVAPAVAISMAFRDDLERRWFSSYKTNVLMLLFAIYMGLIVATEGHIGVVQFAGKGTPVYQEIGRVIRNNIKPNEVPVADIELGLVPDAGWGLWVPPQAIWYSHRFFYSPPDFQNPKLIAATQNFKGVTPVFLTYKEKSAETSVQSICQDQWEELPETVLEQVVVACRSSKLQEMLIPKA